MSDARSSTANVDKSIIPNQLITNSDNWKQDLHFFPVIVAQARALC